MNRVEGESRREKLWEEVGRLPKIPFGPLALDIFRFQAAHNSVYRQYLELIGCRPQAITDWQEIPALPISLFKGHDLRTGSWEPETTFTSSGTTGPATSRHPVRALSAYLNNTVKGFEHFYGSVSKYAVLALLPAYLERQGSSLVAMAGHFIRLSAYPQSGFFLKDYDRLVSTLRELQGSGVPTLLLGVSFALLDLAERGPFSFPELVIMETGGMKGRRREMIRSELHEKLRAGLGVAKVHSEYGMTELFSQAYSTENGIYQPAPTMRVRCREITDPFTRQASRKTGLLNIVDLANVDTISFIATDDLGRVHPDGSFEVLGRHDQSDLRGCNLLVS